MTSTNPSKMKCLWMDLKTSSQVTDTPAIFERHCWVARTTGFDAVRLESVLPDFVVLEFDYPTREDLARAITFKKTFASIPMVVVTVQHSEALAVWFFRAKFFDYLVHPLPGSEVTACVQQLEEISTLRQKQQRRNAAKPRSGTPHEAASVRNVRTQLQPAITLVERNYHQRLLVTEAATLCNMAPFRFGREFKEQFGMDFREYVLRYRIREACRLLRNPQASITEVGYTVGFGEPSYFTKMFKKLVGLLPSQALGMAQLEYTIGERESGQSTRQRPQSNTYLATAPHSMASQAEPIM
jgi:AraC-like DNA-binding protein